MIRRIQWVSFRWDYLVAVSLFLFVVFLVFQRSVLLGYGSYSDLGIYSDALRLIHWGDLNPFIPGRSIRIFNDHFDPILIPFSFLTRLISPPTVGIAVEAIFIVSLAWPLLWLVRKRLIRSDVAGFVYFCFLLNIATLDAVQTPFHPTTWAVLPLFWVFASYYAKNWTYLLVSLAVLFLFREEFPLFGITLGMVLIVEKNFRIGATVLAISTAFAGFVFGVRPRWFEGDFSGYGAQVFARLLSSPLDVFLQYQKWGLIKVALFRTLPFLLMGNFSKLGSHWRWSLKIFLIGSPIIGIRFVMGAWTMHYGTAAMVVFVFAILPWLNDSFSAGRAIWIRAGVFMIFAFPVFNLARENFDPTGKIRTRFVQLQEFGEALSQRIGADDPSITLVTNRLAVYHSLNFQKQTVLILGTSRRPGGIAETLIEDPNIRWFWFEKPGQGDIWPNDADQMNRWIDALRSRPNFEVVRESGTMILFCRKD